MRRDIKNNKYIKFKTKFILLNTFKEKKAYVVS